ncbi:probable jasmonic acid carboxyl methyltransferase 1 [Aristolochia californica]|uniref:probable jasmonic acid carboxyl methyltransferase 1 n=1 Tax=Aristolochia californica TaxID=171875 RepID=UPI0035D679DC
MEVQKVLHMVRGIGENSYANNSAKQRLAIAKVKPIVQKTIIDLYSSTLTESLAIGDLGCSSGPNTLVVISEIIDAIDWGSRQLNRPMPELTIFLNDLPGNDFNSIFQSLTAFYEKLIREKGERLSSCFIAGMPGSFYGRLFRRRSLHFIHSSFSLHWLSQVPPELSSGSNKGNIYLSETSPPFVFKAYMEQFKRDFQSFLRSRSEELVSGGRMVLALLGRRTADPPTKESCYIWKMLAQALYDLVSGGLIEEAKLDAFNLPYYAPSVEELTEVVEKEGSFNLNQLDIIQVSWDGSEDDDEGNNPAAPFDEVARGLNVAKVMRAVVEPLLVSHFGVAFMDEVFQRYGQIVAQHLSLEITKDTVLVVTLMRNG